jgi:hypothetical protein
VLSSGGYKSLVINRSLSVSKLAERKKEQVRGALLAFEEAMKNNSASIPGDDPCLPIRNIFSNGIYVREIRIPAGMFVMGRIHRQEHPNILVQGSVIVLTEEGVKRLDAPLHMLSPAGTKRFLYTLTDTIWTTIHRCEATTQEEAEEECVADTYEELDLQYRELQILGGKECLLQQ